MTHSPKCLSPYKIVKGFVYQHSPFYTTSYNKKVKRPKWHSDSFSRCFEIVWFVYWPGPFVEKSVTSFIPRRNKMVKVLVNKLRFITSTWFITIIVNICIFSHWCLTASLSFCIRTEVLNHKTSLASSHFIEVPVPRQESGLSCICVLGVSMLPLSAILIFKFGIVPTAWYCCFSFHYYKSYLCKKCVLYLCKETLVAGKRHQWPKIMHMHTRGLMRKIHHIMFIEGSSITLNIQDGQFSVCCLNPNSRSPLSWMYY